jgi:hypothetical protein
VAVGVAIGASTAVAVFGIAASNAPAMTTTEVVAAMKGRREGRGECGNVSFRLGTIPLTLLEARTCHHPQRGGWITIHIG